MRCQKTADVDGFSNTLKYNDKISEFRAWRRAFRMVDQIVTVLEIFLQHVLMAFVGALTCV
jgi:hypothetical protein